MTGSRRQPRDGLELLVGFGRALRARGLPVGTGRIVTFCRAVAVLAPLEHEDLRRAGRAALVGRVEDFDVYDEAFTDYFGDELSARSLAALLTPGLAGGPQTPEALAESPDGGPGAHVTGLSEAGTEGDAVVAVVAGSNEVLRHKSFEELSEEERAAAFSLIRQIAVRIPVRRARRTGPEARAGAFDMRRTLRSSLRTQGEPFHRAWRARRSKPRPLVLILDISGSMTGYSRALVQFGFAAMNAGHRVEVFCFGTRLTRATSALRRADPDEALASVAAEIQDWGGGTRIGASLKQLLDDWGQHAALRGALVVLCSDGLERGDPGVLAMQMARLGRLAAGLVWVNPLKGSPAYQPLARGMAAALPHVDLFLPGHNVASLEELSRAIGRHAARAPGVTTPRRHP